MLKLRTGGTLATVALATMLFPLMLPTGGFGAEKCDALQEVLVGRMARIENEWPPLAAAVRYAVHAEFNYFTKQVRGFLQSEITRDAPDYFLSLARRLGGYLKAVEGISCALAWRNEIDDYFYDYFAFADSVDKALHRLQRQQERQEQKQNEIFKFMGWHPSLYHDQSKADSDDESGTVPPA